MMAATAKRDHVDGSDDLIRDAGEFSVEFPVMLSNHLPMVLYALAALGGDADRQAAYFATYRDANALLPVPPPVAAIDAGNWRDALGMREREADYRAFFAGEVARLGRTGAIDAYLPALAPGIAASALHGLMRLAYACLRQDARETAIGLAYIGCTWLPLRPVGEARPETGDPVAVLARMREIGAFRGFSTDAQLLWHWMRDTAALPEFAAVPLWRDGGGGLAGIAAASLRLMAATMTFEAVHAVTGSHWLRLVRGHGCDEALMRHFWQAIAAVYPKIGMPELPGEEAFEAMRRLPCPDWPEIAAAAAASYDEHDLSYVFSAREEQQVHGDRLYQVTAARRMGLIA